MGAEFTLEQFNHALRVTLEWGPNRSIPAEERLSRLAPGMTPEAMQAAFARCADLERLAYALAPQIKGGTRSQAVAQRSLEEAFPGVEPDLAASAINQALYYHWKDEGY